MPAQLKLDNIQLCQLQVEDAQRRPRSSDRRSDADSDSDSDDQGGGGSDSLADSDTGVNRIEPQLATRTVTVVLGAGKIWAFQNTKDGIRTRASEEIDSAAENKVPQ